MIELVIVVSCNGEEDVGVDNCGGVVVDGLEMVGVQGYVDNDVMGVVVGVVVVDDEVYILEDSGIEVEEECQLRFFEVWKVKEEEIYVLFLLLVVRILILYSWVFFVIL